MYLLFDDKNLCVLSTRGILLAATIVVHIPITTAGLTRSTVQSLSFTLIPSSIIRIPKSMLSKSSGSVLPQASTQSPSTTTQDSLPRTTTQSTRRASAGSSSLSSPTCRISNPSPTIRRPSHPRSVQRASAPEAQRSDNGTSHPKYRSFFGWNQDEDGPLDERIIEVLETSKEPKDYMKTLHNDLVVYRSLAYDGRNYRGPWVPHIVQLNRVMEQMRRTGECVIDGETIRP
jgi:hypothetical protein